jgi:hypothetical protein
LTRIPVNREGVTFFPPLWKLTIIFPSTKT